MTIAELIDELNRLSKAPGLSLQSPVRIKRESWDRPRSGILRAEARISGVNEYSVIIEPLWKGFDP